jgi:hypothetical protein
MPTLFIAFLDVSGRLRKLFSEDFSQQGKTTPEKKLKMLIF